MKCGVVVFPGSNCDHDVVWALEHVLGHEVVQLWHDDEDLQGAQLVVLPGGFAYGDYLRAGAMAALSPVMAAVGRHAAAGGLVLGICNGFQVLLEAGLLPGAMRRNESLRFLCQDVYLKVESNDLPFTRGLKVGQVLRMPIAHAEGNYEDSAANLDVLEANGQVAFRYVRPDGSPIVTEADAHEWNPNGAARAIAGIANARGNVMGLMPHPERAVEELLGNVDGLALFASAVSAAGAAAVPAGAAEPARLQAAGGVR